MPTFQLYYTLDEGSEAMSASGHVLIQAARPLQAGYCFGSGP